MQCTKQEEGRRYLKRVLARQQVNDLKGVLDNATGHQLLAVVATLHHKGAGQTLHNGALSLAEALGGVASRRVGQVTGELLLDGDVVLQRDVIDADVVAGPAPEELNFGQFRAGHHIDLLHNIHAVGFHVRLLLERLYDSFVYLRHSAIKSQEHSTTIQALSLDLDNVVRGLGKHWKGCVCRLVH